MLLAEGDEPIDRGLVVAEDRQPPPRGPAEVLDLSVEVAVALGGIGELDLRGALPRDASDDRRPEPDDDRGEPREAAHGDLAGRWRPGLRGVVAHVKSRRENKAAAMSRHTAL